MSKNKEISIESRVIDVIIDTLRINQDKLTPEANFSHDLGADSMDIIELFMAIEKEFGIKINYDHEQKLKTIQNLIDHIKKQLESN